MIFDGDLQKLANYFREMADLMGLADWVFEVSPNPPTGESVDAEQMVAADCNVAYGRKKARLRLAPDWCEIEPEALRHIVTHELVHCHFEPVRWQINSAGENFTQREWNIFHGGFKDAYEVHIDGVATAWARLLPLPIRDDAPAEEAA